MDNQLNTIRDQQKETWNKFSGGWKKWNKFTMDFLKPMGDAIIQSLNIQPGDIVLDIASGTGEPAFSIALLAANGKVYATDLSDKMLEVAAEAAQSQGVNNIEFKVADVSSLPFDDNFFDKVSCRMGFMFFPDIQLAANEMFRVCKAGGRAATCVWAASQDNDWVTTIMKILSENIEMPAPQPGSPGMFRCAKPGMIKELFENAGFKNVQENIIYGKADYDTAEYYWQNMMDVAAPVVGALSKADDNTRKKIKNEVFAACNKKLINGRLVLNYASTIISGEK